jgi:hypothetical protein
MLTGIFASVGILLAQLNVWRQPYSNKASKPNFQPLFHMHTPYQPSLTSKPEPCLESWFGAMHDALQLVRFICLVPDTHYLDEKRYCQATKRDSGAINYSD